MMPFITGLFSSTWRKLSLLVVMLFVTAIYLHVFPSPTLTYVAIVLVHAGVGVVTVLYLLPKLRQILSFKDGPRSVGWFLIVVGAGVGIALLFMGTSRPN